MTNLDEDTAIVHSSLPWPDDDTLHAVLFRGHRLVAENEVRDLLPQADNIILEYHGTASDVQSMFSVRCETIEGDVNAGQNVECDTIEGDVSCNK